VGAQTVDEDGKPVEVRTVGYVGASQGPNGIIHLVTSRTNPDLHIELNEAWIRQPGVAGHLWWPAKVKLMPGTTEKYRQDHADGTKKVTYSAGIGADERYLLDGPETWYYENGQKQWEVHFKAGDKVGTETYYNRDGTKKWQREHRDDGSSDWTVYDSYGKAKARSAWKHKKLVSYLVPKL
jgi:hypothetical protein